MLTDNYNEIRRRIDEACARAGREPSEVTLVAVSKFKPEEMIEELYAAGVRDFGENYPQEFAEKYAHLAEKVPAEDPVRWHFIGHLQRNKARLVAGRACLIHSVASEALAAVLQKEADRQGLERVPVLVEVNIADEDSKSGIAEEDVIGLVRTAAEMPALEVMGLMAMAPASEDPEDSRPYFRRMRQLRERIRDMRIPGAPMTELSMGMTGDFEVAVEEGATIVRVGTAIFGAR